MRKREGGVTEKYIKKKRKWKGKIWEDTEKAKYKRITGERETEREREREKERAKRKIDRYIDR